MGIPMLKIRRSRDRLMFNMGIPILVRRHLYTETAPGQFHGVAWLSAAMILTACRVIVLFLFGYEFEWVNNLLRINMMNVSISLRRIFQLDKGWTLIWIAHNNVKLHTVNTHVLMVSKYNTFCELSVGPKMSKLLAKLRFFCPFNFSKYEIRDIWNVLP